MKNIKYLTPDGRSEQIDYLPREGAILTVFNEKTDRNDIYFADAKEESESEIVIHLTFVEEQDSWTCRSMGSGSQTVTKTENTPFKYNYDWRNTIIDSVLDRFKDALIQEVQQLDEEQDSFYIGDDSWKEDDYLVEFAKEYGLLEKSLKRFYSNFEKEQEERCK